MVATVCIVAGDLCQRAVAETRRCCVVACSELVVDILCADLWTCNCRSCKLPLSSLYEWDCRKRARSTIGPARESHVQVSGHIEGTRVCIPFQFLPVDVWMLFHEYCVLLLIGSHVPHEGTMRIGLPRRTQLTNYSSAP